MQLVVLFQSVWVRVTCPECTWGGTGMALVAR